MNLLKRLCKFSCFLIFAAGAFRVNAQDDFSYLKRLSADDSSAIYALILYPKEVRDAMLEATLNPEALVKLQSLQSESNQSFRDLMSQQPRDEQEKYWDLIRYKGLVSKLAEGGKKSESEVREILKDYPTDIHDAAVSLASGNYEMLVKINERENSFHQNFKNLLKQYPTKTQESLQALVDLPEVISLLQENISLVVLVGEAYRKNPDFIRHKADSLSLEVARQNAEDVKAWTKTLEENPEATEELKQSAKEYAKEYGYDESDYTKPQDTDIVEIHHYYDPYPYWCGWPWWYPSYWWYPYPYWYHWGFYFSDGGIMVFGLPSYFYVSWYFYYPIHHYYYPYLSDAYIDNYHYGPRRTTNSVSRAVDDWQKDKDDELPPDLLNDDAQRVARLKEYGKFEEEYARYNLEKPDKPLNRQGYYEKNEKKYPDLNYPKKAPSQIQKNYPDDIYERKPYPTKKEIEKKTYDRKWVYPEKKQPDRQYYPNKQLPQNKQVEPQRKVYPQKNVQPQKKFIPQQQIPQKQEPQKQLPQRQAQPKSNVTPKTGGK